MEAMVIKFKEYIKKEYGNNHMPTLMEMGDTVSLFKIVDEFQSLVRKESQKEVINDLKNSCGDVHPEYAIEIIEEYLDDI